MTILILMLITLILILILNYAVKKDLNMASNYLLITFITGNFFAILGNYYWKEVISPKLYFVVLFSIIFFIIGEHFLYNKSSSKKNIVINNKRLYIVATISLISLLLNIYHTYQVLMANGYSLELGSVWRFLRIYKFHGEDISNYFVSILVFFSHAAGYISIYYLLQNIKKKNIFLNLFIIGIMLINFALSTDRSNFIYLLFYTIYLYLYNYKQLRIKSLITVMTIGAFTMYIFIYFGNARSFGQSNMYQSFLIYSGSSLVSFSKFLESPLSLNNYIGEETFAGIRILINRFIPTFYEGKYFLEFVYFTNSGSTNIYTGLRSFIKDFGHLGNLTLMFLMGITFGLFSRYRKKPLLLIIYAYFISKISYLFLTPAITTSLFTISQIFQIGCIILIYKIFYRNENRYLQGGLK